MAEHTWPGSLPDPLIEGYQRGGGDDGVLRSEIGRASKQRPKFTTAPPEPVVMMVAVDQAGLQTLLDFYYITLKRVKAFNMRDHTKPDAITVEYRFKGRPQYVPNRIGTRWKVTLQLEQLTNYQGTFPLDIEGVST